MALQIEPITLQCAAGQIIDGDAKGPGSVCRHWARGFCNRGITCGFLHTGPTASERMGGVRVVQRSDEPCKDFSAGRCNRGETCKYMHIGTGPKKVTPSCRDWLAGTCNRGDQCKYKHDSIPAEKPFDLQPLAVQQTPPSMTMQAAGQNFVMPQFVLTQSVGTPGAMPIFVRQGAPTPPTPVLVSPQTVVLSQGGMPMSLTQLQTPPEMQLTSMDMLKAQVDVTEQLKGFRVGTDSPLSLDSHPTTFTMSDGTPQSGILEPGAPIYARSTTMTTHEPYACVQ